MRIPREKLTFDPYPADWALLRQEAKDKGYVSVAVLVREIVGNYCVDKRRDKRLTMPVHHYSRRNADDFADVE
jgi:hypothetical protein